MNVIYYHSATNLGNWLFQIAFARILGNSPVAFYASTEKGRRKLQTYQELYPDIKYLDALPKGLTIYTDSDLVKNNFILPTQRDNLLLDGYFQFQQVFDQHHLRAIFPCPVQIEQHIQNKYPSVYSKRNTVGISIRRGDYLKLPHRHPFVGREYLKTSVMRFEAGTMFIVCSDDISWCKKFFTLKRFPNYHFTFIEGETVLTQLYIHTFCCHNIISNSTFSWWGACLNPHAEKRVIFPSRWYGMQIKEKCYLYFSSSEIVKNSYTPWMLMGAIYYLLKSQCGKIIRYGLKVFK